MTKEPEKRREAQKRVSQDRRNVKTIIIENWAARFKMSGLKQKEVAQKAGVTAMQLSNIMTGRTKSPSFATIYRVETVLKELGDAFEVEEIENFSK